MNENRFRGAPKTVLAEDCSGLGVGGQHEVVEGLLLRCSIKHPSQTVPRKNWSLGELWKLGVAVSWWVHQVRATSLPKIGRCGHELPAVPGPVLFFLEPTLRHWPESRDHRRQTYSTLEPSQPDPSCSTTTTQLRWPSSMLQPTTLRPFLTLQAHDENPPYPLLVRPGRRICERRRRQQRQ